MNKKPYRNLKNVLACLLLSLLTGIITGGIIFVFKTAATVVIHFSERIYLGATGRYDIILLMLLGAILLGLISALIAKFLANCSGGGIPTSIAILRGMMEFRWLRNVVSVFFSALVTFFGGVPLGTEGPSVQMGTAVGRGAIRVFAKKQTCWDRYIMTGGACAGFAAATTAPLTAIFFAFEEAHRRFSPMIFMSAASAVISGTVTIDLLDGVAGNEAPFFSSFSLPNLPTKSIYVAAIIGIVSGVAAIIFTLLYRRLGDLIKNGLAKLSIFVKIPAVFVLTVISGLLLPDTIGSGHSLTESLLSKSEIWYMVLICFVIRAILLILANNSGVTGGLFLPTLAFGAIIGSLLANTMISLSLLDEKYYTLCVVIGIVSFLGASSRTPIMAMAFSAEALGGMTAFLPIALGVTLSYIIIEVVKVPSFTDSVVENKVSAYHNGKKHLLVDTSFTVQKGAFAIGKELHDLLLPPTCVVTSLRKADLKGEHTTISEKDILHLHYTTIDAEDTFKKLEALFGEQEESVRAEAHQISSGHFVPDN